MKAIKRILCPVDLYDFQPGTAESAKVLAAALDAKITVVYVMEPLPPRYFGEGVHLPPSSAQEEEAERGAKAKMAEFLSKDFNEHVDKGEVLFGYAAEKIVQAADEYSADMIIMASHGRSMMGRVIHGSVTNSVLANTKIPVLVVHPEEE